MNLETEISGDLWAAVRRSYESQAWSNSILDAIYFLSDQIRTKSGLQSDGTALAGQAFGGKSPKLKLNRLQTESEINLQAGIEQIVRGIYQAIRNPRSHEKYEDNQQHADSIILFVNYLLSVVGHAKAAFSVDEVISRIRDKNFVPNKRYAELILNEVPRQKRLNTLIIAFAERDLDDSQRVREFFQASISSLDETERALFFETVSAHLQESNDDSELRSVLQILDRKQWTSIGEAARMRSENRLLRSIKSGRYSQSSGKCLAGGLATWGASYLPSFTLKSEVSTALYLLLRDGDKEAQDYVFKFFFHYLDDLSDAPTPFLMSHFEKRLKEGDKRYRDAIYSMAGWTKVGWEVPLTAVLEKFQEAEDTATEDWDGDISF